MEQTRVKALKPTEFSAGAMDDERFMRVIAELLDANEDLHCSIAEELSHEDFMFGNIAAEVDKSQNRTKVGTNRQKMNDSFQKQFREVHTAFQRSAHRVEGKIEQQVISVNASFNMFTAALTRLLTLLLNLSFADDTDMQPATFQASLVRAWYVYILNSMCLQNCLGMARNTCQLWIFTTSTVFAATEL